jgi:hypothetical protein
VRYSTFLGVTAAILLVFSPVAGSAREEGVLLSPTDYSYLLTQGVPRDSPVLQKMSPKELRRLHQLINDDKTQSNPQSKIDAVRDALADFEGNQSWEKANPGHLWDAEKRRDSGKLIRN